MIAVLMYFVVKDLQDVVEKVDGQAYPPSRLAPVPDLRRPDVFVVLRRFLADVSSVLGLRMFFPAEPGEIPSLRD